MSASKKFLLKSTVFVSTLFFAVTLPSPEAFSAGIKLIYRYQQPERHLPDVLNCRSYIYTDGTTAYMLLDSDTVPVIVMDISNPRIIKKISDYFSENDTIWKSMPDAFKGSGIRQIRSMGIGDFGEKRLAFITTSRSIQMLDCTDPHNMFNMGTNPKYNGPDWSGPTNVKVKSPYIFITNSSGFRIFKYSKSAQLKGSAPYELVADAKPGYSSAYSLDFEFSKDGRYIYLAGFFGLDAYDIAYINNPVHVFRYDKINFPYKAGNKGICVKVDKNLLFLGTYRDLRIFDITNPAAPKPLKDDNDKDVIYPMSGPVLDIALYGKYVFLYYGPHDRASDDTRGEMGLEIADISDPRSPKVVDSFSLGSDKRFPDDVKQKMALAPERGIAILGADTFYVLDVKDYINEKNQSN